MNRKKILIVDDSPTQAMFAKMLLRDCYDVVMARDGKEGVESALHEKPDLILMDVVMPRMTGFEAVEAIRKQETTKHIPIIMVTTRGEEPNVETGYEKGCNDYLTKPVVASELLAKVRSVLG